MKLDRYYLSKESAVPVFFYNKRGESENLTNLFIGPFIIYQNKKARFI